MVEEASNYNHSLKRYRRIRKEFYAFRGMYIIVAKFTRIRNSPLFEFSVFQKLYVLAYSFVGGNSFITSPSTIFATAALGIVPNSICYRKLHVSMDPNLCHKFSTLKKIPSLEFAKGFWHESGFWDFRVSQKFHYPLFIMRKEFLVLV